MTEQLTISATDDGTPAPRDLGVPHDEWRSEQFDLFLKTQSLQDNGGGFVFGEAPTGIGKTAVAAALGHNQQVLYVAGTLGLLDQAKELYGFVPIKGRQAYECVHVKKRERWISNTGKLPTCADCHYAPMTDCAYASQCHYIRQKHKAFAAKRAACTYKYLALSKRAQFRGGVLVMDECHISVDELLGFAQFSIDEWQRQFWGLPQWPMTGYQDVMSEAAQAKVLAWLSQSYAVVAAYIDDTEEGVRAKKMADRLGRFMREIGQTDWFLECGPGIVSKRTKGKDGQLARTHKLPGLVLRALDVGSTAARLWEHKDTVLLMSATIGANTKALAGELGIDDHKYYTYNHPVPGGARPVFNLGLPRMTKRNLDQQPGLLVIQAAAIADFINELPSHWRGIVLTSSNKKVQVLRGALPRMIGKDRVLAPPENARGTSQRIQAFIQDGREGLVAIDTIQGWGHGLDLTGELGRFAVVAGVPFDSPVDPFTKARRKRPNGENYYWWSAYHAIPQACGRVARGEILPNGKYMISVAALADGTATSPRALKHFPHWFDVRTWRKNGGKQYENL